MVTTPVVFIIFNRPEHTAKVFEQIALARPRKLLVIADGPRRPDEADVCAQTRAIIDRVDWECELLTNYAAENLGCRKRVSSGIDWIFSQVEEAIILEDDCVPDPTFFAYCEFMLERYRNDERVMMVSGSNWASHPLDIDESYVFSRYPNIWGWASWRRAWSLYDVDMKLWPVYRDQGQLAALFSEARVRDYYEHVWNTVDGIDTWDFQWAFTCLFNNGLCIVPKANLITNIGVVGTHFRGETTNINLPTSPFDVANAIAPRTIFPDCRYDGPLFASNGVFWYKPEPAWKRFVKDPRGSLIRYVKLLLYPIYRVLKKR